MIQSDNLTIEQLPDTTKNVKGMFESLKGLSFDDAVSQIANSVVNFSFKLLIAILVFYVGRYLIGRLYKMLHKILLSRNVDPSLSTFVLSLVKMLLYFILIVTIVGILGLETSSFLAIFASAGVAIGMALSGTLQNFAGGVLILLLKPYKVGDYIEASGFAGTVRAIQIFHTIINTPDNKTIIIPNGGLSTGSINNYSAENYRRVDWTISLSYDTDFKSASEAIKELLLEDDRVVVQYVEDDIKKRLLKGHEEEYINSGDSNHSGDNSENEEIKKIPFFKRLFFRNKKSSITSQEFLPDANRLAGLTTEKVDRSPFVGLNEMADSSINLTVRAWTHSSNYWALYFAMNESFFTNLPKKGFSFPFPQLDVHLENMYGQ